MFQGPDAAMLISPGHKRGDEVYVSEDVDGVHLAHGKGGQLSLALHVDGDPSSVHSHLGALLGDINHAVVEDVFTLIARASASSPPLIRSIISWP